MTFERNSECESSFRKLIDIIASDPVLHHPDYSLPFELHCDASLYGTGAMLAQTDPSRPAYHQTRIIAFYSHTFNPTEFAYHTADKECLSVILALKYFRSFIDGRPVTVFSDHEALKYLLTSKESTGRLCRWKLFLNCFDLTIKHVKGTENVAADALSRLCLDRPPVVATLISSHDQPLDKEDKMLLLSLYHDQDISGGHSGVARTMAKLKQRFGDRWPNMRHDVEQYIGSCHVCQMCKFKFKPKPDLMLVPHHANAPFEAINIDFGELKKKSEGVKATRSFILLVDQCSRFIATKACRESARCVIAFLEEQSFMSSVKRIVSDNGSCFTAEALNKWAQEKSIEIIHSAPYNPSSNGLAERHVQVIKTFMTCYPKYKGGWKCALAAATLHHNVSYCTSIGCTPHYKAFGFTQQLPADKTLGIPAVQQETPFTEEQIAERRRRVQAKLNGGKQAPVFAAGDEILYRKGSDPKSPILGPVRVVHVHVMDSVPKTLITRDKDGREAVVAVKHAIKYRRRALSPVITTALVAVMLLPLVIGQMNRESPLLWEALDTPVVEGFISYRHTVVMQDPCSVITSFNQSTEWESAVMQKIMLWCKLKLQVAYADQMRSICRNTQTSLARSERGIFTVILAVYIMVSVFTGLGAVSSHSLALNEANRALIDAQRLHIEALEEENRLEHATIKKLIEYDVNLTKRVEWIEQHVKVLMEDIPSIAMLTTDLGMSLSSLQSQTANIVSAWKRKRLSPDFFVLHNITELLSEGSLTDYGEPSSCTLDDKTGTIVFEYFLPISSKQSTLFRANPFILFHQQVIDGTTVICDSRYQGTPFVVVTRGCVHPLDADMMPSARRVLVFPSDKLCPHEPASRSSEDSFKTTKCSHDHEFPAQIYFTPQLTFLYCPSMSLSLPNLNTTCPLHPFSLFRSISFTVDGFAYNANSKVIEEHNFNPFDHIMINSVLFPNLTSHDFSVIPDLSDMLTRFGDRPIESQANMSSIHLLVSSAPISVASLLISLISLVVTATAGYYLHKRHHKQAQATEAEEVPLTAVVSVSSGPDAVTRPASPIVIRSG